MLRKAAKWEKVWTYVPGKCPKAWVHGLGMENCYHLPCSDAGGVAFMEGKCRGCLSRLNYANPIPPVSPPKINGRQEAGSGWVSLGLIESLWVWLSLVESGCIWLGLVESSWVWLGLVGHAAQILPVTSMDQWSTHRCESKSQNCSLLGKVSDSL